MTVNFDFIHSKYFKSALIAYALTVLITTVIWSAAHPSITNIGAFSFWSFTSFSLAFFLAFAEPVKPRLPEIYVPVIALLSMYNLETTLEVLPHSLPHGSALMVVLPIQAICLALIFRKRFIAGWLVFLFMLLLISHWYQPVSRPLTDFLALFLVPAIVLATAHTMNGLSDSAFQQAEESAQLLKTAQHGHEEEEGLGNVASQRVQEVRALTVDMLKRIAYDSAPVTAEETNQFRLTEAQLRDTIRGRHIVNKEILKATWEARSRGTRVDILDELGSKLPDYIIQPLTDSALEVLSVATGGTVTIRAFPQSDPIAVMVVYDGGVDEENPIAIEIDRNTGNIDRF